MITVEKAAELSAFAGKTVCCPQTFSISADTLRAFLQICGDRQAMHIPDSKGYAVVPANLLLSMLPLALQSGLKVTTFSRCFTVSYQQVKFRKMVISDQEVKLFYRVRSVRSLGGKTFVQMELELKDKMSSELMLELTVSDCYIDDHRL